MQRLSEERDALKSKNVELQGLKTELALLKTAQCGDNRRESSSGRTRSSGTVVFETGSVCGGGESTSMTWM